MSQMRRAHPLGLLTAFGVLGMLAWAMPPLIRRQGPAARRSRADARSLLAHERLAIVAHELRTPLGAVRHAVRTLESAGDQRPDVQAACAIIRRQIERSIRLVDDLLLPPGPLGSALGLGLEPVDLAAVVAESMDALRGLVEERGHRLTLTLPPEPVVVRGDAGRLAQVVSNLVWNAAKFTPAGGHIAVTLACEAGEAVLRVRDDGIGIAPGMRHRIFRLFTRAAPAGDAGRGIGLSVVELIVARHGGRVTVHSDGPGLGSEFVVRLPRLSGACADCSPSGERGRDRAAGQAAGR